MKRTKGPKCKCGCGEYVKFGNKFIHGHYSRTRKLSKETKQKISNKLKGRILSKEWRKKISENPYRQTIEYKEKQRIAQTGRKHTEETKLKMSKAHKGKIFSKETKRKMSEAAKKRGMPIKSLKKMWEKTRGSTLPEYRKKQNSLARKKDWQNPDYRKKFTGENWSGENSPNWHGGISFLPYSYEFNKELKNKILSRDFHTCQNPDCWDKDTNLHVHHIDYDKWNNEEKNLITLCNSCNGRANARRSEHTSFYKSIIQFKYNETNQEKTIIS